MPISAPRAIAAAPMADSASYAYAMAMPPLYPSSLSFQPVTAPTVQRASVGGSRSGVCASRHMAAEQRRRARINERLEALRNLVPHSARANTAAFLTEVYDYISALHKQLEKLGGGVIDLNIEATDGKDVRSNRVTRQTSEKASSQNRKRFRNSDGEDDSEVESESEEGATSGNCSQDEDKQKHAYTNVCVPSLFDPSVKKVSCTAAQILEVAETSPSSDGGFTSYDCPRRSAFSRTSVTPLSTAGQDVKLTVGFGSPDNLNAVLPNLMVASSTCDTQISLGIGPKQSFPQIGARPIHPATFSMLPTLHPDAVAAAVTNAAVAAQSWGMAAAVAHAQAQVAAQVHAQVQIQQQAMIKSQTQQQITNCSNIGIQKKKRRVTSSENCTSRRRTVQGIVRPIALKPQC